MAPPSRDPMAPALRLAPQPGPYPNVYAEPQAARSSSQLIFPILSGVLAVALVAMGAFSFMTISSTNKTLDDAKASLAAEQAAHKSADAQVTALDGCLAALQTDEASLNKLNSDLAALQARTLSGGDSSPHARHTRRRS